MEELRDNFLGSYLTDAAVRKQGTNFFHTRRLRKYLNICIEKLNYVKIVCMKFGFQLCVNDRAFRLVVFTTGQKMALRVFYFIRIVTKALTYYYINRSQRHLLIAMENNRFGGPLDVE